MFRFHKGDFYHVTDVDGEQYLLRVVSVHRNGRVMFERPVFYGGQLDQYDTKHRERLFAGPEDGWMLYFGTSSIPTTSSHATWLPVDPDKAADVHAKVMKYWQQQAAKIGGWPVYG